MARYRVEFSREWILGRWGFTDRVFYELGGVVTEPSRLENAWLVEFRGKPRALGQIIVGKLGIHAGDRARYGTIFEITEMPPPEPAARTTMVDVEEVFPPPEDAPMAAAEATLARAEPCAQPCAHATTSTDREPPSAGPPSVEAAAKGERGTP
ncbi:MAG: hypothetical protein HY423_06750 [Candidatus Lambdaproteobacteria bacterium]|nr:hypothetical protein [Candidatus Lambdaproteobacteria bacterium]